ncbi:MAG TPA: GNAT family N-acyltransferase [Candidatus Sulfotelmatobacter sp.]|nr:GNAT family N-acyltransferase [Candidatus Sulfotelmatobacter sp.]
MPAPKPRPRLRVIAGSAKALAGKRYAKANGAGSRLRLVAVGGNAIKDFTLRWGSRLLARLTPYRRKSVMIATNTNPGMHEPLPHRSEPNVSSIRDGWRLTASAGRYEIRLTRNPADIAAAQALRYQVFYEEMSAKPTPAMARVRRDFDDFDALCDHLLVLDHARPVGETVIGTYRLLRQAIAERHGGFYSRAEYDLGKLFATAGMGGGLLELGRSCVHANYRTNATIQLLWRGIATYMADHAITHMFGCASLPGTDPAKHALALSYLHHHHLAPEPMRVRALPERYEAMNLLPPEQINPRRALQALPPLIKGYLRLGAYIGDGAVIDQQFGTTDVFILLPMERVGEKYFAHFEREDAASANA